MSGDMELEESALKEMLDADHIQERIDRKKAKAEDFIEDDLFSQAIDELVQAEQLEERKYVVERIKDEEPDMMHLTVPRVVSARNEITSKIQVGELIEIDIDGVIIMTEIDSIQEDDIGEQFGLQLEVLNDE